MVNKMLILKNMYAFLIELKYLLTINQKKIYYFKYILILVFKFKTLLWCLFYNIIKNNRLNYIIYIKSFYVWNF